MRKAHVLGGTSPLPHPATHMILPLGGRVERLVPQISPDLQTNSYECFARQAFTASSDLVMCCSGLRSE
jgi:hypothetical protein